MYLFHRIPPHQGVTPWFWEETEGLRATRLANLRRGGTAKINDVCTQIVPSTVFVTFRFI